MAPSEKEREGEKQTGRERERDLVPKEGEGIQKEATGLNNADSIARFPEDPSICRSYSKRHLSLKKDLL